MEYNFVLDPDTVRDCADHPAAARAASRFEPSHPEKQMFTGKSEMVFREPDIHHSQQSERCDSAYCGSECLSTGSRLSSATEVSQRLGDLHLDNRNQQERLSSPEIKHTDIISRVTETTTAPGRPHQTQKRPSDVLQELVLTSDAYDQDEEGDTPLIQSIICEKEDIAMKFIRFTSDPSLYNIRNCLGQTALIMSVLTWQKKVCRALVVAGASVDVQDQNGNTALHLACATRNFACVQALTSAINQVEIKNYLSPRNHRQLKNNLSLQLGLKNYEGLTCVHMATLQGNITLVQYLVSHGANVNEPDGKSGRTALHYAVEMNNFNLVQVLITTLGANVDAVTFDLCTPLHLAAGRGHSHIAYMLHGVNADTQVQNFEGQFAYELTSDLELQELLRPLENHSHIDIEMN